MANSKPIFIIGGICLGFIIILLLASITSIEPTQWGLYYNGFSKNIDLTTVYGSGLHFLLLWNSFITFPATYETIEFSKYTGANSAALSTRTAEGLAIQLHVAFQYQLIREELGQLYGMANLQYEQTFIRIARDTILQEAGSYEAPEYWTKRAEISAKMLTILNEELKRAHATCKNLQILKIDLPTTYEDSIVSTQVEVQKTRMKQFDQEADIIKQDIEVLRSAATRNATVINSEATSQAYFIKQTAEASARTIQFDTEAEVYAQAKTILKLSDEELSEFLYYQAVLASDGMTVVFGLDNAIVQLTE